MAASMPLINPHLRAVAHWRVAGGEGGVFDGDLEKVAQPPDMQASPGGGGGMGGGAPPAQMPDPMAMAGAGGGGAPPPPPGPLDPASLAQITQAVQGTGAAGGPGGKGGGKKAEQQLLDTKLWTIQYLLVKLCEASNVQVPPSIVVGPPPDQMMMQQAQQEQAMPGGGGATMQDPNAAAGGGGAAPGGGGAPPAGPAPISPMDPSQGPIGGGGGGEKAGEAVAGLAMLLGDDRRQPFDVGREYSLDSLREVRSKAAALAALSRSLKQGAA